MGRRTSAEAYYREETLEMFRYAVRCRVAGSVLENKVQATALYPQLPIPGRKGHIHMELLPPIARKLA